MKFLVTGGSGYVGSYLCSRLVAEGHAVVNYDLRDFRIPPHYESQINYQKYSASLAKIEDLMRAEPNIDGVFHLAAITSVTEAQNNRELTFRANLDFTKELITTCQKFGITNFVVASSASVYGNSDKKGIYSEESECKPLNFYGESKKSMEEYLELASKSGDLNCWVLRFFNISGGDFKNKYQIRNLSLINVLLNCLHSDKEFIVNGNQFSTNDGSAIRDYVHLLDVIESYVLCMQNLIEEKNSGFNLSNVGSTVGHSVFEVISTLEKVSGRTIRYKIAKSNSFEVGVSVSAEAELTRQQIWRTKYSFEEIFTSIFH
jgi:UDP-glucose 4-epimerase